MSDLEDDISELSSVSSYTSSPRAFSQIQLPSPDDIMVTNVHSTPKVKIINIFK